MYQIRSGMFIFGHSMHDVFRVTPIFFKKNDCTLYYFFFPKK